MNRDVNKHWQRFQICQRSKGTETNAGLYMPLSVPDGPWQCISMDFVLGLLPTEKELFYYGCGVL